MEPLSHEDAVWGERAKAGDPGAIRATMARLRVQARALGLGPDLGETRTSAAVDRARARAEGWLTGEGTAADPPRVDEAARFIAEAERLGLGLTQTGGVFGSHVYRVEDGPKMLRETLCVAQALLPVTVTVTTPGTRDVERHRARLQRLIDECDRKRPLGPDGRHGDRHTPECGCDRDEPCGAEHPWLTVVGRCGVRGPHEEHRGATGDGYGTRVTWPAGPPPMPPGDDPRAGRESRPLL